MELEEIVNELKVMFDKSLKESYKRHIIIWHDANEEFIVEIDQLELLNVKVLTYDYDNAFKVRFQIEKENAEDNILLYVPKSKDDTVENPLVDIYLYSDYYLSDGTAILLRTLNLSDKFRNVIEEYKTFFKSKKRSQKFEKYLEQQVKITEEVIDYCVLGSLCGADYAELNNLLIKFIHDEYEVFQNSTGTNKAMEQVTKYGVTSRLWLLLEQNFGYYSEIPSLREFIMTLFMTYVNETTSIQIPLEWESKLLINKQTARIFIEILMKSTEVSYSDLSNLMVKELGLNHVILESSIDDILLSGAFKVFDEIIITKLAKEVSDGLFSEPSIRHIITERQKLHWYSSFEAEYNAIVYAMELVGKVHRRNITDINQLFDSYVKSDFGVDQAYRKFYSAYSQCEMGDVLGDVRDMVENLYVNEYLANLSVQWSNAFADQGTKWEIGGLTYQKDFFMDKMPKSSGSVKECVVVIVSDGLRYEVADELKERMVQKGMRSANFELTAMQTVIPSITELGMAALLPHNQDIEMNDSGKVFVKGIDSNGIENRRKILNESLGRMAYKYEEIIDVRISEFRKLFTDKSIVYIYHDEIDARGDKAASEKGVFDAVSKTFNDLEKLVSKLSQVKRVKQLCITADHGFLYQVSALGEADKLKMDEANVLKWKHRYALSKRPLDMDGTLTFNVSDMVDNSMYVTVPRGHLRFRMQGGGVNYVHGGAMPQEFIVPLLHYKMAEVYDVETVNVVCRSLTSKITSHEVMLTFMQTDKVEEGKAPCRVKIYFEDENEQLISNEAIVIANSMSDKIDDRTYKQSLVIMNKPYSKNEVVYLVMENDETGEMVSEKREFFVDMV